jgi:hypothetical protein
MSISHSRQSVLAALLVPLAGVVAGCGEAEPKMVTAPPAPVATPGPPPEIPGRKEAYGSNKKYQDAMERAGQRVGQ